MAISFLAMGAVGLIGATFNLIPETYVEIYKSFTRGDIQKAMALQRAANAFSTTLKTFPKSAYKAALAARGINLGHTRACWRALNKKQLGEIETVMGAVLDEIKNAR